VQPKKKFIAAESARPIAMNTRPLSLSAQKPLTNRLRPYSTPCTVMMVPSCMRVMTPSSIIAGCAMDRFFLVT